MNSEQSFDILLIDDEEGIREVVRDFIELEGFSVKTAAHGLEALEFLKTQTPPLIICDLAMPEMSGFELIEKFKLLGIVSAIVMLSAYSDREKINTSFRYGVLDYIVKPFDANEFMSKLSIWIKEGKRLQEAARKNTA